VQVASIREKSGRYEARVWVGGRGVSKSFGELRAAKKWALGVETGLIDPKEKRDREVESKATISLLEAAQHYHADTVVQKKGGRQEAERIRMLERYEWARNPLHEISPENLKAYRNQRLAEGRSGSTVRLMLSMVSAIYEHAREEWGYEGSNPVRAIKLPKPAPARQRRLDTDEDEFQEAWVSYDPNVPNPVGIGSLYLCAKRLGWQQGPVTSQASETNSLQLASCAQAYRLYTAQDLLSFPVASYKVKGILPDVGLGAIYGSSGSGKSFLSLELGACINQGVEFFGIKTQPCEVTVICLEGEGGLQRRIQAWEAAHGKPMPSGVKFIIQPFEMMRADQVDLLIQALPKGGVVFIDTLNRASPAADENSSKDMGLILEAAKRISRDTEGLVIVVHHTGKDASRGMRGHSSLFAALDGAIEVSRDASGNRSWSVAKSKDGEDGKEVKFRLRTHVLGQDSDGEDITSCTVAPDNSALFVNRQPNGKVQQAALTCIKREINASRFKGKCSSGKDTKCVRVDDAITALAHTLTTIASNRRRNRANQLVTALVVGNFLCSGLQNDEGWLWLG
jgi:hypothetical protein